MYAEIETAMRDAGWSQEDLKRVTRPLGLHLHPNQRGTLHVPKTELVRFLEILKGPKPPRPRPRGCLYNAPGDPGSPAWPSAG